MRTFFWVGLAAALVVAATAAGSCGGDTVSTTGTGGSGATGTGTLIGGEESLGGEASWQIDTGSGGCNAVLYEPPVPKSPHVEACSSIDYLSLPPTSGPHYGRWAHFQNYDQVVPWGYLVHSMEHGAVVFTYNCNLLSGGGTTVGAGGGGGGGGGGQGGGPSSPCADTVLALYDYVDSLPLDETCQPLLPRRVIIAPAPDLDVGFAVSAWGFMMKADCLDTAMIDSFYADRYAKGPEDLCGSGIDPFSAEHTCE